MGSQPSDEVDPIAKKLREAATRREEATDAAAGEKLLTADFAKFARDRGPTEFENIEQLVLSRTSRINAQNTPSQPQFRYAQNLRSIEAGIFSASFAIVTNGQFQVRLIVGLASDALQRMAEPPVVERRIWHYLASADQDGFFWWDEAAARKCLPDEIVSDALEGLSDLLIAPLRFEDEGSF